MSIPVCCITGRIAGDSDACGDCDPCSAAHAVPDVVKRLLAEKDEWRQMYAEAAAERDALHYANEQLGAGGLGGDSRLDQQPSGEMDSAMVPSSSATSGRAAPPTDPSGQAT